jgi:hypothetical protein
VFGGAIRGGAKLAGALDTRRGRIEAVEAGLADGTITRTNDLDAALAVERRAFDLEEQNPLGRDVAGMAEHGRAIASAERTLLNGEVPRPVPREQALTPLPEADRQAVSELVDMANTDPTRFAEAIRSTLRQTGILERIGIDASRLTPEETAARLRAATSTPGDGRPRAAGTDAQKVAETRADAQRLVTAEEQAAEIDAVREQSVRDLYQGREDSTISIETEDGLTRNMTVRELFDEFDRGADELESLSVCIAGGARKAAAAAAGPLQSVGKAIDTAIQGIFR